jgi:nucleotide-binding universal stress UspA family protein
MNRGKSVLLIGLEPHLVDFSEVPMKLDEATLRAGLAADEQRLRDLGYDASWLLVDRGETAEAVVAAALEAKHYDAVLVGAGIRTIPTLFLLFEKLVNAIHAHAPHAKLCFNTHPQDTAESVRRWV